MRAGDKFVHDNEFQSHKACKGSIVFAEKERDKSFEENVSVLYLILLNTPDTVW